MPTILRRFGIFGRRGVAMLIVVGMVAATAAVLFPMGSGCDAALELVLLGEDGRFASEVRITSASAVHLTWTGEQPSSSTEGAADGADGEGAGPAAGAAAGGQMAPGDAARLAAAAPGSAAGAMVPAGSPGVSPDAAAPVERPLDRLRRQVAQRESDVRLPLIFGIRNGGTSPARPGVIDLAVPFRYRLAADEAELVARKRGWGEALNHYRIEAEMPVVEPGRLPVLLPRADTLWLEPVLPAFECVLNPDSVPEILPARGADRTFATELRVFYSFSGGDLEARQTGLLTVEIDPALLELPRMPPVPRSRTTRSRSGWQVPDTIGLRAVEGFRTQCGPPDAPVSLGVVMWQSPQGSFVWQLEVGGVPRKIMMDLDGDGVIETEIWDSLADGHYEARRETRIPVPSFLLPPLEPRRAPGAPDREALDAPDTLAPGEPRPGAPPVGDDAPAVQPDALEAVEPPEEDRVEPEPADTTPAPRRPPRLLGEEVGGR